jgi:hypothetical protein
MTRHVRNLAQSRFGRASRGVAKCLQEPPHEVRANFIVSIQRGMASRDLLHGNPILHDIVLSYPRIDEIGWSSYATAYRVQGRPSTSFLSRTKERGSAISEG